MILHDVNGSTAMSAKNIMFRLAATIDEFRSLDKDIPGQAVVTFLVVAQKPGISSKELLQRIGVSQASISRNLALLGEWDRHGNPGLQLVDLIEDPVDRRNKIAFLTPRGKALVGKIANIMEPGLGEVDLTEFPTAKEYVRGVRGAR
jgi:DNA-binding MarR family transcriptional regulator